MIQREEFVKAGEHLKIGEQLRINHDECSSGRDTRGRLYVKRKDIATLLAYCHNCGDYGIFSLRGKTRAIRDLLIENEVVERDGAGELVLPPDVTPYYRHFPLEAQNWLLKYGITTDEMSDAGICYSPSWNRLILPVYEGGKLVFWQGRAINDGQDPKYVSAKAHPKVMYWHIAHLARKTGNDKVFIVEDMLSAIKLGRHVDTVALLGTSPDFDALSLRLSSYNKVGILLDPDTAGISKAHELQARMSLVFMGQVRKFIETKQPKEMTNAELEKLVIGL